MGHNDLTPNQSRPALMIPGKALADRGGLICERLVKAEWGMRSVGEHHGANSLRAFREHLVHKTREAAEDGMPDEDKLRVRTEFFGACDYASLLLLPLELQPE